MTIKLRKWTSPDGAAKKAWTIDVLERAPDGHTIRVRHNAPKNAREGEARDYEHKVRTAIRGGTWCEPCDTFKAACRCAATAASRPTVNAFSVTWQNRNRRECAFATVDFYDECLRRVFPQLGAMILGDVKFEHVEAFKAHLLDVAKLAPVTVNNTLRTLRALLQYGDKSGLFGDRRAPRVDLLPEVRGKGKFLTAAQSDAFLEWTRNTQPAWYPMCVVLLATGLRIGEITALEWRDIDLKGAVLRVNRTQYLGQFSPAGSAERVIPLEADALRVLKGIPRRLDTVFVFPRRNGKPQATTSSRAFFDTASEFMRGLGVDEASEYSGVEPFTRADNLSAHVLRHTFATRKVGEGVPLKVLSVLMGHASVSTTEIYAKVTDDVLRAAMGQTVGIK